MYDKYNENQYLLTKDEHNSHATLDVVHTTQKIGLGVSTISSHTSHATPTWDVSIFKLFKTTLRKYHDI